MISTIFCIQEESDQSTTESAISDILNKILSKIKHHNHPSPKGVLVFFDIDRNPQVIVDAIYQAWPDTALIGCSGFGVMNTQSGFSDDAIQVMAVFGDVHIDVHSVTKEQLKQPELASEHLLNVHEPPSISVLLSEVVHSTNTSHLLQHLKQRLPKEHTIIGGMASDSVEFNRVNRIVLIANRSILPAGAVMMHFYGNITATCSSSLGWISHGRRGEVTQSSDNRIESIDHQPALNFYLEETGGVHPTLELPLSVFSPEGHQRFSRACLGDTFQDHTSTGINTIGNVPEGSFVRIAYTNKDALITSIKQDMNSALTAFPNDRPVAFGLFFSCASRRIFLSSQTPLEASTIIDALPHSMPGMGLYTFGEIGRLATQDPIEFHNNCLVSAFIG